MNQQPLFGVRKVIFPLIQADASVLENQILDFSIIPTYNVEMDKLNDRYDLPLSWKLW